MATPAPLLLFLLLLCLGDPAASGEFTNPFGEVLLLKACFLNKSWEMTHDLMNGPFSPKNILVEVNKTIEDPTIIAGGHILLREETVMSFGAGLGRSRLRSNFVPMICKVAHTPAMFNGHGADTPKGSTSGKRKWSGYCGDLVFWILFIFGVRFLDAQVGKNLLVVALVCPLIMGCRATKKCTRVVDEFQFCWKCCNTGHVFLSLDCCIKLGAAASTSEKNTSAPCTCYIVAEKDNGLELMCDTAKLLLFYEFCGVPLNRFPYTCKGVVLPPLQPMLPPPPTTTTANQSSSKKKSLFTGLLGYFKVGMYIVGSFLTLIAAGVAIWCLIRYLVLNRPVDNVVGTKLADLAIATGKLSFGSVT